MFRVFGIMNSYHVNSMNLCHMGIHDDGLSDYDLIIILMNYLAQ